MLTSGSPARQTGRSEAQDKAAVSENCQFPVDYHAASHQQWESFSNILLPTDVISRYNKYPNSHKLYDNTITATMIS